VNAVSKNDPRRAGLRTREQTSAENVSFAIEGRGGKIFRPLKRAFE
jgi:hypothetical protein